jgi:threonine aldolase
MKPQMIDLRSDTVTRPTPGMREAMMQAQVGDDVFGDDPTVNLLQERVAKMFGKEAALFFPSGTMANQVAIKTHVEPGDEVLCDQTAHVYRYEGGGIAATSGASVRLLNGERGMFTAEDVLQNINADDAHFPKTALLCLENTVNRGGGACWPSAAIEEVCSAARKNGIPTHLDGARLWNAMVSTGQTPIFFGENFDSISICFSKGLGCPVGSVLVGSKDFIYRAHRHRKRLGGGMRQVGFLAAACLYALENHIDRLKEDHKKAKKIAAVLERFNWVKQIHPVETNMVLFRTENTVAAAAVVGQLKDNGVLCNDNGGGWIRMVFHLDISAENVTEISEVIASLQITAVG